MNKRKDARKYYEKGRSGIEGNNFKAAVVDYSRAIRLNRKNLHYPFAMAQALAALDRYKESSILYKRVLMMDSTCAKAYYNLGSVLDMLGKTDESIEMYRKAICFDPLDGDGYKSLATLLRRKGNYEEAYENYMKALELKPEDAFKVANGLGCLYFMQGMFAKAIEEFEKSISLNGKFTYSLWNMSLVLFCENRNEEAEKFFEDGLKALEEEAKIYTIKDIMESYTEIKTRFEAKLDNDEVLLNEEQIKIFRVIINGLTKMINLLSQHLDK